MCNLFLLVAVAEAAKMWRHGIGRHNRERLYCKSLHIRGEIFEFWRVESNEVFPTTSPAARAGVNSTQLYGPMNSSKISPRDTQMRHASQHNHAHQNPTLYGPPLFTPSAVAANSTNVTQQQKPLWTTKTNKFTKYDKIHRIYLECINQYDL